ncbi:MAG TPA: RHS repeat-associated core domain-containing protein, partial [Polyangium sp.]|nr:RHS repeat-associated core domain-containing protein [Polyangium sp.]
FHTDHLGSIDVVTKEDGSIDERRSYDAFGARRNPEWGDPGGPAPSNTTRGFTGHEEDDEFGLVNMKGRIFDPHLGRFTTTDPVIADIWDGQSLNRYAYVFNNPLAFVDPTGFQAVPHKDSGAEVYVDAEGNIGLRQWILPPTPKKEDDFITPNHAANIGAYVAPVDVETTGSGGAGLPQETTDSEPSSWINDPYVNGAGGFGVGLIEGIIPGSALAYDMQDLLGEHDGMMRQARIGRSLGQLVGGLAMMGVGILGEISSLGISLTGVGAVVGVPAATLSAIAVAGGTANVLAGIRGLAREMTGGGGTRGPPQGNNVRANAAQGKSYEEQVAQELEADGWKVSREVTLETPGGARTRMDIVGTRGNSVQCVECKSSSRAPLTPGQTVAHPQIAKEGAVVVGKGKPDVPGGTQIPPTIVEIRRP